MLDQAIRFGAILAQPEFQGAGNLLEVGSGSRGITAFLKEPVIGVDVKFVGQLSPNLTPLKASATDLPFRNGSFDRVVCSDMLEHLESHQRKIAIMELLRITKGTLFLAFPCDDAARRMDRRLSSIYKSFGVKTPDWLEDHLHKVIPDSETIRQALIEQHAAHREISGESALMHFLVSLLTSMKILNRLWEKIFGGKPERIQRFATMPILRMGWHYRKLWVITVNPATRQYDARRGIL